MSRRINYEVGFTANTNQLHQAVDSAVKALQSLGSNSNFQLTKQLQQASSAAMDLANNLTRAFNQQTGKLDLVAFQQNLQKSGMTVQQYANQFTQLGLAGQQAFFKVAQAIATAELPMMRTNKLLDNLWITMKNTARWQLTSSALHGFMGAIQTAYGYTKDLNSSLNNIRIVTKKNIDQMDRFAESANKAARALSTTTTDYTNASLIYYQQGLDDEAVQARTETTIKFANAARESAEQASEELTSIWNNFDNGTESLEFYADALVALGASTASSSAEIAAGIQKFAASARTIGLSYEYSAAALATITATTRESADIVGNALKTLFSRMEGLSLGETLDDGTDLNKYSQALEVVGVHIKEANGELRDMDEILNDLGNRWGDLGRDQQVALSQTVAGVRQYAQLIALMDNWDFFQKNLETIEQAEGTLDRQAEIYADSWEAARDRVRAAAEDIYDSIISDDMFISLDNALTPTLSRIADVIDAFGGMKGVVTALGIVFTRVYGNQISTGLRDLATNLKMVIGLQQQQSRELKASFVDEVAKTSLLEEDNIATSTRFELMKQEIELQGIINKNANIYTEDQKLFIEGEQAKLKLLSEEAIKTAEVAQASRDRIKDLQEELTLVSSGNASSGADVRNAIASRVISSSNGLSENDINVLRNNVQGLVKDTDDASQAMYVLQNHLSKLASESTKIRAIQKNMTLIEQSTTSTAQDYEKLAKNMGIVVQEGQNAQQVLANMSTPEQAEKLKAEMDLTKSGMLALTDGSQEAARAVRDLANEEEKASTATHDLTVQTENCGEAQKKLKQDADGAGLAASDLASKLVQASSALFSINFAIQGIKNLGSIITNEDLNTAEKWTQILSSVAMLLPMVIPLIAKLGTQLAALRAGIAATEVTATAAVPYILGLSAILVLITAIGLAIYSAHDKAVNAGRYAREVIEESTEAYKKEQEELDSLNSKLDDTIAKIDEINSKDTITLTDKEDLARLQEQKNILEQEVKLQQARADLERRANSQTILDNWEASLGDIQAPDIQQLTDSVFDERAMGPTTMQEYQRGKIFEQIIGLDEFDPSKFDSFNSWLDALQARIQNLDREAQLELFAPILNDFENVDVQLGYINEALQFSEKEVGRLKEAYTQYNEQLQKNLEIYSTDFKNYQQEYANFLEGIVDQATIEKLANDLQEKARVVFSTDADYYEFTIKPVLADEELEGIYAQIASGAEKASEAQQKALLKYGITFESLFKDLRARIDDFNTQFNDLEIQDFLKTLNNEDLELALSVNPEGLEDFNDFYAKFYEIKKGDKSIVVDLQLAGESAQDALTQLRNGKLLDDDTITQLQRQFANIYDLSGLGDLSLLQQAQALTQAYVAASNTDIFAEQKAEEVANYRTKLEEVNQQLQIQQEKYDSLSKDLDTLPRSQSEATEQQQERIQSAFGKTETGSLRAQAATQKLNSELQKTSKTAKDLEKEKIELEVDLKDAEKELTELQAKAKFDIKVDIDEGYMNGVLAQMAQIDKAVGLIGEDFKVEVKNVEELAKTMPELFEDAVVDLETGIVQLSQTIVDQAAQTAYDTAMITQEDLKQKLQARIEEADAEIDLLHRVQDIALSTSDDTKRQEIIDAQLTRDEKRNVAKAILTAMINSNIGERNASDMTAEASVHNSQEMANASESDAKTTANNWASAATAVAKAMRRAFQSAAKDQADFTSGRGVTEGEAKQITTAVLATGGFKGSESSFHGYDASGYRDKYGNLRDFTNDDFSFDGEGLSDEEVYTYYMNLAEDLRSLGIVVDGGELLRAGSEGIPDLIIKGSVGSGVDEDTAKANAAAATDWWNKRRAQDTVWLSQLAAPNRLEHSGDSNSKGSGKSGSGSEPKLLGHEREELVDPERYARVNKLIDDQDRKLKQLDTTIERSYGVNRLENFAKEIEAVNGQIENYQSKLTEATDYLAADAAAVVEQFSDAVVDSDTSIISNIEDLVDESLATYNEAIKAYNAWMTEYEGKEYDEDEKKRQEDTLKIAKEKYELESKVIKQYKDTSELILDTQEKLQDMIREQADRRLRNITYKMEVILDVKSAKQSLREFSKEISASFGDALTHTLQVIGSDRQGTAQYAYDAMIEERNMYGHYLEEYTRLSEELTKPDSNINEIRQELQSLEENIISSGQALLQWIEDLENLLPDALDAARERFERFTNQLEHNVNILSDMKELLVLQGDSYKTDAGFERLQRASEEILNAQIATANLNKQWMDSIQQRLAEAELDLANSSEGEAGYDILRKNRDALLQEFNSAQEAMLSATRSALETAQEIYKSEVEKAVYDMEMIVSDGEGFDLMKEKQDHFFDEESWYLDEVDTYYQQIAWYSKLQADIEKTTNTAMKKELETLKEEVKTRSENNKLSEYDLEILEAKYKVLQAQMALEDAQNNKSQLRLVRDSQGNWNYQYTTDAEQIADKQAELLKAENEWYQITKEQSKKVSQEILDTWINYRDKLKEIQSDLTLTEEERAARTDELTRYTEARLNYLNTEMSIVEQDMIDSSYNSMAVTDELAEKLHMSSEEIAEKLGKIRDAMAQSQESVDDTMTAIGDSASELDEFVEKYYDKIIANLEAMGIATGELTNEQIAAIVAKLQGWVGDFSKDLDKDYLSQIGEAIEQEGSIQQAVNNLTGEQLYDIIRKNGGKELNDVISENIDSMRQTYEDQGQEELGDAADKVIIKVANVLGAAGYTWDTSLQAPLRDVKGRFSTVGDAISSLINEDYATMVNYFRDNVAPSIRDDVKTPLSELKTELGYGKTANNEFVREWLSNLEQLTPQVDSFGNTSTAALNKIESAYNTMASTIDSVTRTTETSIDDLSDAIDDVGDSTNSFYYEGQDTIYMLDRMIDEVQDAAREYSNLTEEIYRTISAMEELARQSVNQIGNASGFDISGTSIRDDSYDHSTAALNYWLKGNYDMAYQELQWHDEKKAAQGLKNVFSSSEILSLFNALNSKDSGIANILIEKIQNGELNFSHKNDGGEYLDSLWDLMEYYGLTGYATGGYTGDWGANGKLAILHEKELILNQDDTEKILNAVDAVRAISPMVFASIEKVLSDSAASFAPLIGNSLGGYGLPDNGTLEQRVEITATFPNVSTADQIQQALIGLVDEAAQWANMRR